MIRLEKLSKKYGRYTAVDSLDLSVEDGEIFGFLGPNGAGKTTTIRMIAGLIQPSAGDALLNGISITRTPIEAKAILGLIPDRPYLYEKLTGREYLRFICGVYGVDAVPGEAKATEMLATFGLANWADELVEGYSHGMKQRLIMAGALVHDPKVLVVDEPMIGLDPRGARLVKEIFKGIARADRTVFLSTHSLGVAEELCDRVGILSRGKLVAVGTVEELKARSQKEGNLEEIFLALTAEAQSDEGSVGGSDVVGALPPEAKR
ncbi:MAG TPA: ABC transporter ATP-binding protein [bacterium]|nr:ABC transporter ATP-binding protein [bacterium]